MLHKKAFYTQKKNRKVIKVVKEHYLRDDVWCAAEGCSQCKHAATVLSASPQAYELLDQKPHYIVPDTNIFMNQIDLIEHPAFKDVIVLQTVLQEVNHLSQPIYARLRLLISDPDRRFYVFNNEHHRETYINRLKDESPNDRNDRAIRVAIKWYSEHLERNAKPDRLAVMMSDDADNRAKAKEAGIAAFSVREYVAAAMVSRPELMDIVADNSLTMDIDSKFTYKEHLLPSQVAAGIKAGAFHQGTLNISMHNYLEGTIMGLVDGTERQIYIIGRAHLNRAVQSDVVAVQMLPKNEWRGSPSVAVVEEEEEEEEDVVEDTKKDEVGVHNARDASGETAMEIVSVNSLNSLQPTGKVVGIVRRNWRPYCGYIDKLSIKAAASSQNVFFYAMDRRIPKIKIRTRQAHTLKDQRIVVAIDSWPNTSRHPIGHFVKALGAAGDKETETEVLLLEHDVPYQEFAPQVLKELPPEGDKWMVQPKHFEGRIDLRELNICSIDPPGCTDIDDALHIRSLPNGNYEIGVHIADVTHFVKPNMTMDNEAAHRGTTVYLVDKRIDMLPSLLGTNLCSLRSNVDRLAFSCLWEITEDAEIVNVDFKKSVIRSKHSFTYEEAQNRIDDIRQQDDVTNGIRILNSLAKLLRQRRLDRGALTLASPEVRFNLENDSQDPVDVEMKELQETNALVEEFMLLANISVAEKIFSKFPDSSMLRRHAIPPDSNFEALEKAVSPLGITLKHDTSKALSDSLDAAILPHDPFFNRLLRIMTTRCMMQAVYFCSGTVPFQDFRHYGLATDIYTHFTSPIRRYSDVVVHRLLAACINPDERYGSELTDKLKMKELCDVLNHRHRMAQQAARSSVELYTNLFFKNKLEQTEGHVVRVLKNGFIVLVPKYGIEGIVYTSTQGKSAAVTTSSPLSFNPQTNSLDSLSNDISIRLFSQVVVQITVSEDLEGGMRQKMKMSLVEPVIEGLSLPAITMDEAVEIVRGKKIGADGVGNSEGQRAGKKARMT